MASIPFKKTAQRLLVRILRLAAFGVLSFVGIAVGYIVYRNYQLMLSEVAPAPATVDLPPGLPIALEEVNFAGEGGVRLAGWYVTPANGATIILLHGYGGTRADMLWHAQTLVQAGYGVLLYDERASGESEGERRSYGWEDSPDVGGAIAFINERNRGKPAQVGIGGCSIGGQIALQAAVRYPEITAVWADGPSNVRAVDSPPPQNAITGFILASNYLLDFLYVRQLGIAAPTPMIEQIGSIAPRPVMLVGGGTVVGEYGSEAERVQRYAAYAGPNAQVWVIDEAVHCDGPGKQPAEYARRIVEFFDQVFFE